MASIFEPESTGSKEKLWAALDDEGESKVRERLVLGLYGDAGERREHVLEWLRSKVQNETPEVRAASAEGRAATTAERHARAARRRAKAAKRVKIRASIALILATILAGVVLATILAG
jgi:hypothetical protein